MQQRVVGSVSSLWQRRPLILAVQAFQFWNTQRYSHGNCNTVHHFCVNYEHTVKIILSLENYLCAYKFCSGVKMVCRWKRCFQVNDYKELNVTLSCVALTMTERRTWIIRGMVLGSTRSRERCVLSIGSVELNCSCFLEHCNSKNKKNTYEYHNLCDQRLHLSSTEKQCFKPKLQLCTFWNSKKKQCLCFHILLMK